MKKEKIAIIKNVLIPENSLRNKISSRTLGKVIHTIRSKKDNTYHYDRWVNEIEPTLWSPVVELSSKTPLISIITPAYNTPLKYLGPLVDSVLAQTYSKWELILVDGGSSEEYANIIANAAKRDKRIKHVKLDKNLGIAGNTNAGINNARGEYIAFLDHDDTLSPFALNEVVSVIQNNQNADIIYSDEDKLHENGINRMLPFFKPDWSPELMFCVNYITHFFVVKKILVDKIKGVRSDYDGAQDYDFALRLLDSKPNVVHIPKILYHWRLADGSTAISVDEKSTASDAGRRTLEDYIKRNKINATLKSTPETASNHHISYRLKKNTKVSIVIPFKDKAKLTRDCVESILDKTPNVDFEIILISNNSTQKSTFNFLDKIKNNPKVKVLEYNKEFNWSAINNFGVENSNGDVLVFLNNDTKVINNDWLCELAAKAQQKDIGAVGPALYYPDKKIQHAGVVIGMTGMAGHVFRNQNFTEYTIFGFPYWSRNYLAVTGACMVVEKQKYQQVGGFNEEFIVCGSDITFCLDLYKKGYRNVYWPFAKLYHYESKSVKSYENIPKTDYDLSLKTYEPFLTKEIDPLFNPNLSLATEKIDLKRPQD